MTVMRFSVFVRAGERMSERVSERTEEMEDAVNHQILLTMKNIPSSGSEPVLTTEV